MTVEELRKFYKVENNSQLSKKISKGRSTLSDWESKGIPPRTQAALEVLTRGKLKADLSKLSA